MTKTQLLLSAAFAGIIAAGSAIADDNAAPSEAHVKCYGIAKAGQNACANATGTHACKGEAKVDNDAAEFTLVAAPADCDAAGGKTAAPDVIK